MDDDTARPARGNHRADSSFADVGPARTRLSHDPPIATDDETGGCLIRVKAVPGAARDGVVGRLGDRLKVRVAAPPEGGKANEAICALLARELGAAPGDVRIERGESSAQKVIRVRGVRAETVNARW